MDNKNIVKGLKKLRDAIGDFIDNMNIDDAEKNIKGKKPPKPGSEDDEEEDKEDD